MNKEQKGDSETSSPTFANNHVSSSVPVIWKASKFFAIKNFDCIQVDLQPIPEGGSYFTRLAISSLDYRKNKQTKAMVRVNKLGNGYTEFLIYDDWGSEHQMLIPNYMKFEIENAINSAKMKELLA